MGGIAGQAREARLIEPLWMDGPLGGQRSAGEGPIVWSVRLDSEAAATALAQVRHSDRDLADFAAAPDAGHRLLRRRLTRALLARLAGIPAESILFGRTPEGAPTLLSPKGWHMSVAGRAPLCLIGVARDAIGVDVEPVDAAPPLWDMLTPREAAALDALTKAEQPRAWLRRWCAKEAHAKRLGFARRADPTAIETSAEGADTLLACSAEGTSRVVLRELGGRIEAIATEGETPQHRSGKRDFARFNYSGTESRYPYP